MATHPLVTPCVCGADWGEMHRPECPTYFERRVPASDRMVSRKDNGAPDLDDGPVKSDGGSSDYYKLPQGATDLQDLIEDAEMSFARGNLFKALYRLGEKAGTSVEYDLNKLQWFLDRMKKMHRKGLAL